MPSPFTPSTVPGSGSGGLTLLGSQVATGTLTTLDSGAAGFGTTFSMLYIVMLLRCDTVAFTDTIRLRFNADATGTAYFTQEVRAQNGAASGPSSQASGFNLPIMAASSGAGFFTGITCQVPAYGNAQRKSIVGVLGYTTGAIGGTTLMADAFSGWWDNTAAVTRVQAVMPANNFITDSALYVYGI